MCLIRTFDVEPKTGVFYKVFTNKDEKLLPAFRHALLRKYQEENSTWNNEYETFIVNKLYENNFHAFMTLKDAQDLVKESENYHWATLFPHNKNNPEIWAVQGTIIKIGYLHHSTEFLDKTACIISDMRILYKVEAENIIDLYKKAQIYD